MDTLVSTENGLRPIEEIQAGDYVWSENTETGKKELKKVLSVSVTEATTLVHVTTENGTVVDTTENHPFYVEGKGWCAAAELEAGDVLRTEDGEQETVKSVQTEKLDKAVKVYNLEIEDSHTYYVSADSVLVHNACAPRKPRRPKSNVDEVVFNSDLSSHYKKTYNGQQFHILRRDIRIFRIIYTMGHWEKIRRKFNIQAIGILILEMPTMPLVFTVHPMVIHGITLKMQEQCN